MARNDIHRPSQIVPQDYQFVGLRTMRWEYLFHAGATSIMAMERARIAAHMAQTGGNYATHQHGGSCMSCGAHAIYLAVFYHPPTNSYIQTGMDCAGKLEMGDERRFRRLKDAIQAAQFMRTGWKKAEGVLLGRGDWGTRCWDIFVTCQRPDSSTLEGSLRAAGLEGDEVARNALRDMWTDDGLDPDAQPVAWSREETVLIDIVSKLAKYGSLSDRQYSYLERLVHDIDHRPEILEKKRQVEAKREAEKAQTPDCPEGRVDFEGVIVKVEWKENDFGGGYGQPSGRMVCVVKSDAGWLVWGTLPSGCDGAEKGDRVSMRAQLKRSDRDRTFGFMSRPMGRILEKATVPA